MTVTFPSKKHEVFHDRALIKIKVIPEQVFSEELEMIPPSLTRNVGTFWLECSPTHQLASPESTGI
jgi:hypothetical protein